MTTINHIFKQLQNLDFPNCLFCNKMLFKFNVGHHSSVFRCESCNEYIEITHEKNVLLFSIEKFEVECHLKTPTLHIFIKDDLDLPALPIPIFTLDFTNKNKIIKKIETYLSFS